MSNADYTKEGRRAWLSDAVEGWGPLGCQRVGARITDFGKESRGRCDDHRITLLL